MSAVKTKKTQRKKIKRRVARSIVFVHATFNNTIVTFTDEKGNPLVHSSAGACGNKGSRKGTPYAAGMAARDAGTKAKDFYDVQSIEIRCRGIGSGRDSVIKELHNMGFEIVLLADRTSVPHNGPRPRKRRRA